MFPHFDQSEYAIALKNAYRQFPAKDSTLDIDFVNNRSRVAGVQGAALDEVTFTRSTTGTYFDAAGVLQTAAINAPVFDYNPVSLRPLGMPVEGSRANSIRNNMMGGAVAGTPGTGPTNWFLPGTANSITQTVVGTGTENGITYVDVKYAGTPSATSAIGITFEPSNTIVASTGQTWAESVYLKLQAGSFTNTATTLSILGTDGTNSTFLQNGPAITSTPANLRECRLEFAATLTGVTTTHVVPRVRIGYTNGLPIDITLRIGLPQMELGAFATSVIPTSGTTVTRGADVASMTGANFSSWYNQSAGSMLAIVTPRSVSGTSSIVRFDDTTANEVISVRGNTSNPELYIVDGGVVQAQIDAGTLAANTLTNLVAAWQLNDAAISQNGQSCETDSSLTLPTPTQLRIGSDGTNYLNGWISRLVYYPKRLPNNLLQYLSRLTA